MLRRELKWLLARVTIPVFAALCFAFGLTADQLSIALAIPLALALVLVYRLDLTNAWVAFTVPWLAVLFFSTLDLSDFSRQVSPQTVAVIAAGLVIGLMLIPPTVPRPIGFEKRPVRKRAFRALFLVFIAFTAVNVALAGYVPLIQALTTGDSGYMDFGVKGLYGLYNAFSNAFGLTAFYFWRRDGDRAYRNAFLTVVCVFVLFVTRQNLVSLVIECFVVQNLCMRRSSRTVIALAAAAALTIFGVIGDIRIGTDIAEVAQIKESAAWLPSSVVWLYSYSYFNILNLDNTVATFVQPALDGTSLTQLLPSFVRPEGGVDDANLIEVAAFNVTSYASPIIRDFGAGGVVAVVALFALLTRRSLLATQRRSSFLATASYAVLYFCFAFSFFVNFWFYLPIIFQPVFLWMFSKALLRRPRQRTRPVPNIEHPPPAVR